MIISIIPDNSSHFSIILKYSQIMKVIMVWLHWLQGLETIIVCQKAYNKVIIIV